MRILSKSILCAVLVSGPLSSAELKPHTERFYQNYLSGFQKSLEQRQGFLLIDAVDGLRERVKGGELFVEERLPRHDPPDGLTHHYEGAVFIPNIHVKQVIDFVQNYDNHKKIYRPEVIDSQLLRHDGNDFHIRLRLLKKKVLTVTLETEHDVHYKPVDDTKWESVSRSSRISEVDNAGSAKEKELAPGSGHGFVWHLDSFWRFFEQDGGVYVECSSVSLSRDIPFGMARIIRPIIADLPEESLRNVLRRTRDGLKAR